MIELHPDDYFAHGAYCYCYEHPSDPTVCIKVPTDNTKAKRRLKEDLKYHHKLAKKQTDLKFIAAYLGACDTSLGSGHQYQCIRDYDSQVSKTLHHYLLDPDFSNEVIYQALKRVASFLLVNRILISDIHLKNILLQLDENGSFHPMIVDGIGDRVALPILNVFPKLVEAKIIRRWNKFAQNKLESKAMLWAQRVPNTFSHLQSTNTST